MSPIRMNTTETASSQKDVTRRAEVQDSRMATKTITASITG